ncbi:MAG: PIN domain-containing protein [Thermoplasmata archaeon]
MSGPSALLDTNIFLSARNRNETGHAACRRLLDRVDDGALRAIVSTISIAEVRAGLGPAEARAVWQAFVSHLLTSPNYRLEPVDASIAEMGGELRQKSKLTLPDALIIATGMIKRVDFVVTQDRQLARLQTALQVLPPEEIE